MSTEDPRNIDRRTWVERNPIITLSLIAGGILTFLLLVTIPVYTDFTPTDKIGLSYGGGPFEARRFQRIVQPASGRFVNGWLDKLYLYPTTQRNYIVSKTAGEGDREHEDFIRTVSRDGIPIDFEVAVYFKLNTDELVHFQNNLGFKYSAWTDDGWDRLLNDYVRQQIEETLQAESRKYAAEALYADEATLASVGKTVGPVINRKILEKAGGNYFCNPDWTPGKHCGDFTVTIKKADIANDAVKGAFAARRESEIAIETERNKVLQAKQQARAIRELQAALRSRGYLYVLLEAIKSGGIKFWVLPNDGNFTFPIPTEEP